MIETALAYNLQRNAHWGKICSFDNPNFREFMIRSFNHARALVKKRAREVFILMCILKHKELLHEVFEKYDYYKHYFITSTTILHDHALNLKEASVLRASTLIVRDLCLATNEKDCVTSLNEFACFSLNENRADVILFAQRKLQKDTKLDAHEYAELKPYIPIIISMTAFYRNDDEAKAKLVQDYHVTNMNNFFSEGLNSGGTKSNQSDAEKENQKVLACTIEKIDKYVRILVHPFLSSESTLGLADIVHERSDQFEDKFSTLNNNKHLVIRLSSDSPIVAQWKSNENVASLMDAVVTSMDRSGSAIMDRQKKKQKQRRAAK